MKKILIIIFVLFIPIGVMVGYKNFSNQSIVDDTSPVQYTDLTISLTPAQSDKVIVGNFLQRPDVTEDRHNSMYYFLGNTFDSTTAPYVVTFDAVGRYFTVALLQSPFGESRRAAEQYLLGVLDISEAEMCTLSYAVSVPGYVSESASGEDYRFSFCSDAKQL